MNVTPFTTSDDALNSAELAMQLSTRRARILRQYNQGFLDDSEAYHDLCDLYMDTAYLFSSMPYPAQPKNRAKALKGS